MEFSPPTSYRPLITQMQCPFPMKALHLWHVLRFSTEGDRQELLQLQRAVREPEFIPNPMLGRLAIPYFVGIGQDWRQLPRSMSWAMPPSAWLIAERRYADEL